MTEGGNVLEVLERIEQRQITQGEDVASLKTAVFGTGTTKGIATQVQEIRESESTAKKQMHGIAAVLSAVVAAIVIGVGKLIGLDS